MRAKENDMQSKKISKSAALILALIILAQLAYTVFCFAVKKTGYNGDESWSYGLANSYYQPFIYVRDGVSIDDVYSDDIINWYEWVDGDTFQKYLTVQQGERFSYGSVYHNQTLDHHPPLYYMLLHTVCSFFPDSYSLWYGFALNCVFLVVTQIFLYRLARLMLKNDVKPLVLCAAYAATSGALSTNVFVRQYSLLTMLTVVFFYFAALVYCSGEKTPVKYIIGCAVTSFAAFFTHYYAIFLIGVMTALLCIWCLCKKKIKRMFVLGLSELAALGLFFAAYPAFFAQVSGSRVSEDHILDYFEQLRLTVSLLLRFSISARVSVMKTSQGSLVLMIMVFMAALIVPLCFLFRKEKWYIAVSGRVKAYLKNALAVVKKRAETFNWFIPMTVMSAGVSVMVINWLIDSYFYNRATIRYLAYLVPLVCLAAFYTADMLLDILIHNRKKVSAVILVLVSAFSSVMTNFMGECPFFAQGTMNTAEIRNMLADKNVVLVMYGKEYVNAIETFTAVLNKTAHAFPLMSKMSEDAVQIIPTSEYADDIDYLIIDKSEYYWSERQKCIINSLIEESGTKNISSYPDIEYDKTKMYTYVEGEEASGNAASAELNDDLETFCPRADYDPVCVMDANGSEYVILHNKTKR